MKTQRPKEWPAPTGLGSHVGGDSTYYGTLTGFLHIQYQVGNLKSIWGKRGSRDRAMGYKGVDCHGMARGPVFKCGSEVDHATAAMMLLRSRQHAKALNTLPLPKHT